MKTKWAKIKATIDPKVFVGSTFEIDGKPLCVRSFDLRPDPRQMGVELVLVIGAPGFEASIVQYSESENE